MTKPPAPEPALVSADRRVFHMKSCLGRGGFGEVYRATMAGAGGVRMEVAVKVLHAEVDPLSQAVQRLRDEARLLGAIRHPSVLAVHGLVMLDGRVALITEYVEGADLDKCVRGEDPIPRRGLVEMVARVAEALDASWRAPSPDGNGPLRLVHRDIKPANIRLGKHGEVKLLDFGIARAGNLEREARTETNAMLGSYLYMAPERFLDGSDHGPAIDVFSLGCTLYECLVGARLFGELTLKDMYLLILDEQKYEKFVQTRLDALPRDIQPEIVSLLYRMVALSPRQRPGHPELSRICGDLADRMPGKSLDRWARTRHWPPPKQVRGVLDGAQITETHFSTTHHPGDGLVPNVGFGQRTPDANASGAARRRDSQIGDTFEGVIDLASRTVSSTFERPTVVVGMGFGVMGIAAVAAGLVLVVLLLGVAGWQWWSEPTTGDQNLGDVIVNPAPAPVVVAPAPPRPGPRPKESPPEPKPSGETPPPVPVVVVAQPPPQPQPVSVTPTPKPAEPVPAAQNATVTVSGSKVLVKFRGPDGSTTGARSLPPGQYDVVAYFGGKPYPVPNSANYLAAGGTYKLNCSDMKQTCTWER